MLNLVAALPAEAAPLVDRWRLRPVTSSFPYPLYEADHVRLIVSGAGRNAAILATAFLAGHCGARREEGWINVGIAGSAGHPVGTAILAHKVVTDTPDETYYPAISFRPPCATAVVHTVDRVEREYADSDAYEMEASGFCLAASRFASLEQVQVLKIISDGPESDPEQISKSVVRDLIATHLPLIDVLIDELESIGKLVNRQRSDPPHLGLFRSRWHFTASQQQRLRHLLRSLAAMGSDSQPTDDALGGIETGRQVLEVLESALSRSSLRLD
jgi:adenosylhomocysteine nucleosidase